MIPESLSPEIFANIVSLFTTLFWSVKNLIANAQN